MSTASHAPATAPAAKRRPGANGHPCNEACGWAHGPLADCTCICGGARHGSYLATRVQVAAARAAITARIAATGDVFLGGGANLDLDDAF